MHDGHAVAGRSPSVVSPWPEDRREPTGPEQQFPSVSTRLRFVSSIREVVDAEGVQVVSNEIFRPGPDRRAVPASPLRSETLGELREFGYRPSSVDVYGMPA
jgi:hypothetical protein